MNAPANRTDAESMPVRATLPQRPVMWALGNLSGWLRLLTRNSFAVAPSFLPEMLLNTAASSVVSTLGFLQEMKYGRVVARTPLRGDPLFILGHWRSGTTFLQDLLALDDRLTFPTNLECFCPSHFLLTEDLVRRLLRGRIRSARAFDNVPDGLLTPQEDEFALCLMGLPSPLLDSAFPNRPAPYPEYLDLEGLPLPALRAWKSGLKSFLQRVTLKRPCRLVLKSPQHTARIKVLHEMFPDAQFVHIVRNPYIVFASTLKMYRTMFLKTSLQHPPYLGLKESIFSTYLRMFQRLQEGCRLVDAGRFYELRYEDLVRDPIAELRKIYEHLGLPGFEAMLPRLKQYVSALGNYQTNRYDLAPDLLAEITQRWGEVIHRYGYDERTV